MTGVRHPVHRRISPLAWLLIWPIRFYQRWISRFTPPTCRYYPCCSSYSITALCTHGAMKGLLLTASRVVRCNPWSSGGVDHVPERGRWRNADHQPEDGVIGGAVIEVGLGVSDQTGTDHAGAELLDAPTAGRAAA